MTVVEDMQFYAFFKTTELLRTKGELGSYVNLKKRKIKNENGIVLLNSRCWKLENSGIVP